MIPSKKAKQPRDVMYEEDRTEGENQYVDYDAMRDYDYELDDFCDLVDNFDTVYPEMNSIGKTEIYLFIKHELFKNSDIIPSDVPGDELAGVLRQMIEIVFKEDVQDQESSFEVEDSDVNRLFSFIFQRKKKLRRYY